MLKNLFVDRSVAVRALSVAGSLGLGFGGVAGAWAQAPMVDITPPPGTIAITGGKVLTVSHGVIETRVWDYQLNHSINFVADFERSQLSLCSQHSSEITTASSSGTAWLVELHEKLWGQKDIFHQVFRTVDLTIDDFTFIISICLETKKATY